MKTDEEKLFRPINIIAKEIIKDWKNVNYAAKPYLTAMLSLQLVTDVFISEDAKTIILYLLSNASTWKGEVARRIKKELNLMIK